MTGQVRNARLETATARGRLKRQAQPHWQALLPGRAHLGWQRQAGDPIGRWLLRQYDGDRYTRVPLGNADDVGKADGQHVLNYAQAIAVARAMLDDGAGGKVHRMTVRQAFDSYIQHKEALGQPVADPLNRGRCHILPALGEKVLDDLTAAHLQRWLANVATAPAQVRPTADGRPQFQAAPKTTEHKRRRQSSANRVLNVLKAALNHAYDQGHTTNNQAWGRKLKPFRNADTARLHYLTTAEAKRLLNACAPDFRPLVRAGLETGCRYGELTRLEAADFNADAGTLTIRKSKSGKPRHVVLTDDGRAFFVKQSVGRPGHALLFAKPSGAAWRKSEQSRPMMEACAAARITPRITFHGLRHTWASLAVMSGAPLLVVAKNLGHADTRMVEKHYGHLAPSYIVDTIRAHAPRYGIADDRRKVVPLK
jgi:integrase